MPRPISTFTGAALAATGACLAIAAVVSVLFLSPLGAPAKVLPGGAGRVQLHLSQPRSASAGPRLPVDSARQAVRGHLTIG